MPGPKKRIMQNYISAQAADRMAQRSKKPRLSLEQTCVTPGHHQQQLQNYEKLLGSSIDWSAQLPIHGVALCIGKPQQGKGGQYSDMYRGVQPTEGGYEFTYDMPKGKAMEQLQGPIVLMLDGEGSKEILYPPPSVAMTNTATRQIHLRWDEEPRKLVIPNDPAPAARVLKPPRPIEIDGIGGDSGGGRQWGHQKHHALEQIGATVMCKSASSKKGNVTRGVVPIWFTPPQHMRAVAEQEIAYRAR